MYDNLPSSALGTLRLFASTQTEVDRFSDQLIASVKEEGANPIEILVQLRAFEKVTGRVIKEIMDNAITEIDKNNGAMTFAGNNLQRTEAGVSYDFKHSGDSVWEARKAIFDAAQSQLKEREEFLKSLKEPIRILVEETGELQLVRPPLRTSKTIVKVEIK